MSGSWRTVGSMSMGRAGCAIGLIELSNGNTVVIAAAGLSGADARQNKVNGFLAIAFMNNFKAIFSYANFFKNFLINLCLMTLQVEMFDLVTETWSTVRDDPADPMLKFPTGLVMNNVFYFLGGSGASGLSDEIKTYDPDTNSWTVVGTLPFGMEMANAVIYNS